MAGEAARVVALHRETVIRPLSRAAPTQRREYCRSGVSIVAEPKFSTSCNGTALQRRCASALAIKVSTSIRNEVERQVPTIVGRKQRAQYFLEPGFRFLEVTLPRQGYGKFWRVNDEDVTVLAQKLQGA